ncbi:MAG: carbon starvation protein, partial [Verrucomicrobiales bacterium]|nr:carbon starvation protein [Verrucomicrobiales bacterium]
LLLAVWGGQFVHGNASLAKMFTLSGMNLAWLIIGYGFAASVLPVWLLLAPRDYLSTFMKLGTIAALACGVFLVLPVLRMPAISQFVDGSGLVVAGKLFPFCFITIACGAISGFHTLISSGTTPKIITRESYARPIGYGAMCLESLVAIMALIAACTLEPGVYLSMNVKGEAAVTVAKVTSLGYPVTVEQMNALAHTIGEKSLFGRTGGAATLAVGMAQIFSRVVGDRWLDIWYHFAIMFEALFILTTLDAGTRVGRYLLQDVLGNIYKPLGDTKNEAANVLASLLVVSAWGYFLIQGVSDPLGGINSLWPLFGIANQLLAAIALCLATTVLLKMHLNPSSTGRKPRPALLLITLVPLVWLLAATLTAGYQKIYDQDPRIGFLAQVKVLDGKAPVLQTALEVARQTGDDAKIHAATLDLKTNRTLHFNNQLDAIVAGFFLVLVMGIVLLSVREWILLFARKRLALLHEAEPVWLPDYAIVESQPLKVLTLLTLSLALLRELSGEAHLERARQQASASLCHNEADHCHAEVSSSASRKSAQQAYLEATDKKYRSVNRCC